MSSIREKLESMSRALREDASKNVQTTSTPPVATSFPRVLVPRKLAGCETMSDDEISNLMKTFDVREKLETVMCMFLNFGLPTPDEDMDYGDDYIIENFDEYTMTIEERDELIDDCLTKKPIDRPYKALPVFMRLLLSYHANDGDVTEIDGIMRTIEESDAVDFDSFKTTLGSIRETFEMFYESEEDAIMTAFDATFHGDVMGYQF
jgi:hypothetical protein